MAKYTEEASVSDAVGPDLEKDLSLCSLTIPSLTQ